MSYSLNFKKSVLYLVVLVILVQCKSDSCNNEKPTARVESNSYSISSNRVWVTFNHQSGQSFQLTDITEDNPKTIGSLPTGTYTISATVSKSTGSNTIRLSAELKDCIDYRVFVNATSLSMNINGIAR